MVLDRFGEEAPFHLALAAFGALGLVWAVQVVRAPMPVEPALPEAEYARAGVLTRIEDRHPIVRPIERVPPAAWEPAAAPATPGKRPTVGKPGGATRAWTPLPSDPAGTADVDFEAALASAVSTVVTRGDPRDELRLRASRPPGDDADAPVLAITRGAAAASVRTDAIEVQAGSSSPLFRADASADIASVGALLRRYRGRVEACASAATRRDPKLRGRVELAWTIVDGRATDVHTRANQTGDGELAACLRQTLLGIRFSVTGEELSASYAWVFATD